MSGGDSFQEGAVDIAPRVGTGLASCKRRFRWISAPTGRPTAASSSTRIDVLALALDDQVLYEGEHLYGGAPGYVSLVHMLECALSPGEHTLTATLSRTESFGRGMIMALEGAGIHLEPAAIG